MYTSSFGARQKVRDAIVAKVTMGTHCDKVISKRSVSKGVREVSLQEA